MNKMHVTRTPCVKDRLQGKPADPAAEKSTIEPAFPRAFYARRAKLMQLYCVKYLARSEKKSSNARVIWGCTNFDDTWFFISKGMSEKKRRKKRKGEPNDRVPWENDSSVLCDVRQLTFHFASWKPSILK